MRGPVAEVHRTVPQQIPVMDIGLGLLHHRDDPEGAN